MYAVEFPASFPPNILPSKWQILGGSREPENEIRNIPPPSSICVELMSSLCSPNPSRVTVKKVGSVPGQSSSSSKNVILVWIYNEYSHMVMHGW